MRWLPLLLVFTGCTHVAPGCEVIKDTHEKIVCSEKAKDHATDINAPVLSK